MLSKLFNWFQPGPKSRFTQPDLEKGETLDFNFSGTKVRFNVAAGSDPDIDHKDLNLYSWQYYSAFTHYKGLIPADPAADIPLTTVCVTGASFAQNERNGRGLGSIRIMVQVYHNPQASNLFNKAEMEQTALDTIDTYYGPVSNSGHGGRSYEAPLFWEIKQAENQPDAEPWIFYYINNRGVNEGSYQWLVPLSNQHFLMLNCQMSRVMGSGVEAACVEFMENFVAHLEIEYSPDAQRDREKAQAEKPEAQYSPARPAQAWELYDRKPFLCRGGARGIKKELYLIEDYSIPDLMLYFEMFDDPVEDVIWEPKVLSEHPLEEVNGKLDPEYMLRLLLIMNYYYHSVDYSIRNIEAYSASHLPSAPIEDQPKSVVDIYHQHTTPWPDNLVAQYKECLALEDELDAKREAEAEKSEGAK